MGDVCHYVQDKVSALVVPPENPKAIAQAIKFVIDNPKKSLEIGLNGFKVMEKYFSIDTVGATFVAFLENI